MAHALQRGLLALAFTLGVPTITEATKSQTTDTQFAQNETIQRDGNSNPLDEVSLYNHEQRVIPQRGELTSSRHTSRQSHWLRTYMTYEYRGLEGVIHDLDEAGITWQELDRFQRTLHTSRSPDERRMMTAILAVHGILPPETFVDEVSSYVGYHPFANDVYLLRRIYDDNQLRSLFFDRECLVEETRRLQTQTHHRRSDNEGRLYDETPDLDSLDSLNLVRVNLLLHALQDTHVRSDIGDIISADLANEHTEFGGVIYADDGHGVHLQPIRGTEYGNGGYNGQYYRSLIRALGTFHLHATGRDDQRYSGPSVPDLRVARVTNTTGAVITLLGKTATEYTVNIDFFYVDARTYNDSPISAENPVELSPRTVRVVDMGVLTVRR